MRTALSLFLSCTLAGVAFAATPAEKCTSSKTKAASKQGAAFAKCAATASKDGEPIEPTCLDEATLRQSTTFANSEAHGGCITTGDSAAISGLLDEVVTFAETDLGDDGSVASRKCASSRRTAAGTYLGGVLRCRAGNPAAVPTCLDKAEAKLVRAFDKSAASTTSDCDTTDAPSTVAAMNALADAVIVALAGGPTTTSTSTSVTTSTTVTTSTVPGAVSFSTHVQPIFDANCVLCHTGSFPPVGLNLTAGVSYSNLVSVLSGECTSTARVASNSPETSYLVHKLAGEGPCFMGSRMPLHLSPLTPVQQAVVWTWIVRGAAND